MIALLILLMLPQAAIPYHRVPAPKGMGWQSCNCRDVHYIGKGIPASGELRIDYKKLWPGDLTGKPISCQITNGPPKTTITLKEEAWDHITFKFVGPGKTKEMEWSCDFVVPK